jgi:hypothetical protein
MSDCSSGRNGLTSPALGFIVVMMPMMTSNKKDFDRPKATPVVIMIHEAMERRRAGLTRCATYPVVNVRTAEPRSDAATTVPIWTPLNPR